MEKQPIPGPEHQRLQSFVGTWDTEGTVRESPSGPGARFQGVDTYEWIPGEFFLLHRWDAHMPDGRTQGVEIIGYDSASGGYRVRSFDSSGNTDVMRARVANDMWTFEGESLRFTGGFRDGGDTLAGIWEQRPDEASPWFHWMDVTLSKNNHQGERREIRSNTLDDDVEQMSREQLVAEVKRLRQGIRQHRDSTGHELCWHHPALWGLLPDATDPVPTVPDWPQFLQGCIRYRLSLDEQAPRAPRTSEPFGGRQPQRSNAMSSTTDRNEIEALFQRLVRAHAEHDADAIVECYARGAVIYDLAPPLGRRGMNRETVANWLAGWDGPILIDACDVNLSIDGDLAFSSALTRMRGRSHGEDQDMWFRTTMCLLKLNGQWRIVHDHTSVPFYMDGSYRAAVDLKP